MSGEGAGAGVAVELRGVEKGFAAPGGVRQVLRGVDLTITRGEIVAVAGRSGSGKTTLLTVIAGWEDPDAGSVTLLDGATRPDALAWGDLAVVPQSLGLLDELTIAENIGLPLRLGSVADPADAAHLTEQLGIDHLAARFPEEVSLGEQQRAALARAAIVRPRVLLADEPIAHQNEGWALGCMTVLERLADHGTACVLATHNPVAFESAHRVLELRDGHLEPIAR